MLGSLLTAIRIVIFMEAVITDVQIIIADIYFMKTSSVSHEKPQAKADSVPWKNAYRELLRSFESGDFEKVVVEGKKISSAYPSEYAVWQLVGA